MFISFSGLISEPDPSAVTIRNLTYTKLNTSTSEKFDYTISWQKPLFKESTVSKYVIKYTRTGNPERKKVWKIEKVGLIHSYEFLTMFRFFAAINFP